MAGTDLTHEAEQKAEAAIDLASKEVDVTPSG